MPIYPQVTLFYVSILFLVQIFYTSRTQDELWGTVRPYCIAMGVQQCVRVLLGMSSHTIRHMMMTIYYMLHMWRYTLPTRKYSTSVAVKVSKSAAYKCMWVMVYIAQPHGRAHHLINPIDPGNVPCIAWCVCGFWGDGRTWGGLLTVC